MKDRRLKLIIGKKRIFYVSWQAGSWWAAFNCGAPKTIGFWWGVWLRKGTPGSILFKLWRFFCDGVLSDFGVAWDIRKRWESDYVVRVGVVSIEVSFDQKGGLT